MVSDYSRFLIAVSLLCILSSTVALLNFLRVLYIAIMSQGTITAAIDQYANAQMYYTAMALQLIYVVCNLFCGINGIKLQTNLWITRQIIIMSIAAIVFSVAADVLLILSAKTLYGISKLRAFGRFGNIFVLLLNMCVPILELIAAKRLNKRFCMQALEKQNHPDDTTDRKFKITPPPVESIFNIFLEKNKDSIEQSGNESKEDE